MRERPRILLDIDGCFANFIDHALVVIAKVTRGRVVAKHDDIVTYAMEKSLGLTEEECAEWYRIIRTEGYCSLISTYPGSFEAVKRLKELGDVHPVTFPFPGSPWWILERETWLVEQLGLDPNMAIYTSQKHTIAGDVFIEDTTKHLINWRKHNPDGVAIRISRPYNVSEPFDAGITVSTLEALVDFATAAIELREKHHRDLWNTK